MRIPTTENEIGIWYPIGDMYMFLSKHTTWYENCGQSYSGKYRESSYKEFKEAHPFKYCNLWSKKRVKELE